jgi:phosphate transport system permease protein
MNNPRHAALVRSKHAARIDATLARRRAAERRFRFYGLTSIGLALAFLFVLLGTIFAKGYTAFWQTAIRLEIHFASDVIDPDGKQDEKALRNADYQGLVKASLRRMFPAARGRSDRRALYALVSEHAGYELRQMVLANPSLIGTTRMVPVTASADVDLAAKGRIDPSIPESRRQLSDRQLAWLRTLEGRGDLETVFNTRFFTTGDSRNPESAGIGGAIAGSLFTLVVTLLLAFPLGVMAAIYLEEFAPRNRWTDLVEVNINNLAAVPSIVFGLLGLAIFLNFFGLPRSAPLVGGMVLALMTLTTIIIAARAAIQAVPPSIREAALAVGASRMQAVVHHVLPLAMPGVLTGTIIGMARALGESAPLLMIGMVAFIVDIPKTLLDPATVLPVQIYLWADSPERAFVERTSAAIIVLLAFLVAMNLSAVLLRRKFERRW